MVRQIEVVQGSAFKAVQTVHVKWGGTLRQVIAAYVKLDGKLEPLWNLAPNAPRTLAKTAQDGVSVTLTWTAPLPNSTYTVDQYEILRRPDGSKQSVMPTVVKVLTPADGANWANRTWKVTGLAAGTSYIFTVRAVNTASGAAVHGPESNALRVYTGLSELRNISPGYPASLSREFQPTRSDTYSKAKLWATRNGRAAQGTYDDSDNLQRNQYGCVDYSGVYNTLASLYGATVAANIEVTDAWLQTIRRPAGTGGGTSPTIRMHCGKFSLSINAVPVLTSDMVTFSAPGLGGGTGRVDFPQGWADAWVLPPASRYWNGLVIYTPNGNNFCVFAGVQGTDATNYTHSWDLYLAYRWNFVTRAAQPPTTTPYTLPA